MFPTGALSHFILTRALKDEHKSHCLTQHSKVKKKSVSHPCFDLTGNSGVFLSQSVLGEFDQASQLQTPQILKWGQLLLPTYIWPLWACSERERRPQEASSSRRSRLVLLSAPGQRRTGPRSEFESRPGPGGRATRGAQAPELEGGPRC